MRVSITADDKIINSAEALLKNFAKGAEPTFMADGHCCCATADINDADLDLLRRAIDDNNAGKPPSDHMRLSHA